MTESDVAIVCVLATAGFIRGAVGFGDALFAMPLLVLLLPLKYASPLMAICSFLIAVMILWREWRDVEFRAAAALIGFGMLGVPVGVWLTGVLDASIVKAALGLLLIGFSAWSLSGRGQLELRSNRLAPVFGLVAGVLGGAYNTSGPPLVVFASLRRWEPQRFRAVMQAYCLVGSVWIISIHALFGHVTFQVLWLVLAAAPAVIAATILGRKATAGMSRVRFAQVVFVILILLGLAMLTSSVNALGGLAAMSVLPA